MIPPPSRRRAAGLLALLFVAPSPAGPAHAGTVVSGTVSGTWSAAGSPYWVEGDLTVAPATTLGIEPGVEVRFRGPYRLTVTGTILASGTPADSIRFTRDAAGIEWRGIRLVAVTGASRLEYCVVEYVRAADTFPEVRGGAIYCENGAPLISHCLLQNNISHNAALNGMGGGVACVSASPTIEYCLIRDNEADSGGGIGAIETGAAPFIRNNRIENNHAPYAGGGIYSGARSSSQIENNMIVGNTANGWGGGGITLWNWYAAFPVSKIVRNNVVAGNSTTAAGGGFYIRYDYSVLENNTVAGNTAASGGGAYVLNQGAGDFPPLLHNFILWGNSAGTGAAIHPDPSTGSLAYVSYSDVQGGWGGVGNLNTDPLFTDAEYHLDPSSPCVDAGDPGIAYDDACFPPSQGTARNDMGAYGGPAACGWPVVATDVAAWEPMETGRQGEAIRLRASPSPARERVDLRIDADEALAVTLEIFDVRGRRVRAFAPLPMGASASRTWDGTDDAGGALPAGVYLVRASGAGGAATARVLWVR